jgi:hypothetical protein
VDDYFIEEMSVKSAPKSKTEFYERFLRGEFGNRPRHLGMWDDLKKSGYRGRVTIRDMVPGGPCFYGVDVTDLLAGKLPVGCTDLRGKRFNEAMPDDKLLLQGNVWYCWSGPLRLDYSCEPGIGHREAVNQPYVRHAEGLLAHSLLRTHLDPSSYDDLRGLLDDYDDAIIEFSAYSVDVGICSNRKSIFWEIRNY